MKLKRLAPGHYQSADGRVRIYRDVSQQTRHADEVCWVIVIDGYELPRVAETKKEAVDMAARRLTAATATH